MLKGTKLSVLHLKPGMRYKYVNTPHDTRTFHGYSDMGQWMRALEATAAGGYATITARLSGGHWIGVTDRPVSSSSLVELIEDWEEEE